MAKRVFKANPDLVEQIQTVNEIESAMRKKVEEQLPIFEKMPCAQQVTSTQGEPVLKANPAMQEIRALFRDYTAIVKIQKDLTGGTDAKAVVTNLEDMRARFKVAK